jgi:hypothetical protein
MIRVKLDTVAAAGFTRKAAVGDVLAHVRHVGGTIYDMDLAAVMALPAAPDAPAADLADYAMLIAEKAAAMPGVMLHPRPGLGDIVAHGLGVVGVTKERVSRVIGRPCRCSDRQKVLNEIGRKYLGIGVSKDS